MHHIFILLKIWSAKGLKNTNYNHQMHQLRSISVGMQLEKSPSTNEMNYLSRYWSNPSISEVVPTVNTSWSHRNLTVYVLSSTFKGECKFEIK